MTKLHVLFVQRKPGNGGWENPEAIACKDEFTGSYGQKMLSFLRKDFLKEGDVLSAEIIVFEYDENAVRQRLRPEHAPLKLEMRGDNEQA